MAEFDDGREHGDDANDWVPPDTKVDRRWWLNREMGKARAAEQVRTIVSDLSSRDGVQIGVVTLEDADTPQERERLVTNPDDFDQMYYMFRQGRILTRHEDEARVVAALRRGDIDSEVEDGGIGGVSVVLVEDTMRALEQVDAVLGDGLVAPDHVIHVTSQGGGACPATEPIPTSASGPEPQRSAHPGCDGEGVRLSMVDTGFDPDLASRTAWLSSGVAGQPEMYDPRNLIPYAGHGTFAAGMVRAMAPSAEVFVHAFLPSGGAILETDILRSFQQALRAIPDIISMSAGTYSRNNHGMLGFRALWEKYAPKGTVLIAAAGNDGTRKPFFPAADKFAIGVGALEPSGARAGYSNYGAWVDVYARGSDVVNAYPRGIYAYQHAPLRGRRARFDNGLAEWSGTSFSTPLVAGVVAGRMSWSGENAQQAADAVLAMARGAAVKGVGSVVSPHMACDPGGRCQR